ncbi:hypothetical protein H7F33_02710 [Pedobacter sp. PAMC26386]|nr:hypothetical protein H7F33_02710 [Pedobacter sp. PAMC26386]
METRNVDEPILVNFSAKHSLLLKLIAPHFSRKYGFAVSFLDGTEKNRLKYEVEVSYLRTIPEEARIFKIDRLSTVYIDDTEPDLLVDQLAYETGKVFYPLIAEIDFDGKFIGIGNIEEIQERWIKLREEISEYFVGEEVERYLELMDEAIADEELLHESIENDFFIHTYFSNIYKSYTSSLVVEEDMSFPIAGKGEPVNFKVTTEAAGILNSFDTIELNCTGVTRDERSAQDIEQEQCFPIHKLNEPSVDSVKGSYEALYILHKDTKAIESVVAKWKLELKVVREIEVKIFEIETEASMVAQTIKVKSDESPLFYIDGGNYSSAPKEGLIDKLKKIMPWQRNT